MINISWNELFVVLIKINSIKCYCIAFDYYIYNFSIKKYLKLIS